VRTDINTPNEFFDLGRLMRLGVLSLLIAVSFSCRSTRSGLYLDVMDKEFADARVSIDGKPIGALRPVKTNTSDDVRTRKTNNSKGEKLLSSGSLDYVSVIPGEHQILLEASSGAHLEILAEVQPGENYVTYSSETKILRWNDDCFEAVPGKIVRVNLKI
jgi:hypothetical protein